MRDSTKKTLLNDGQHKYFHFAKSYIVKAFGPTGDPLVSELLLGIIVIAFCLFTVLLLPGVCSPYAPLPPFYSFFFLNISAFDFIYYIFVTFNQHFLSLNNVLTGSKSKLQIIPNME